MFRDNETAALEAVLFVAQEPLAIEKLADILELSPEEVAELLAILTEEYRREARGLTVVEVENAYKVATKAEMSSYIERLYKAPSAALSRAALEVLAIVAYHQPVTRGEIDFLRGVQSDSALASLIEKELVLEVGRKDAPGRPALFQVTDLFLLRFGLQSLAELPALETLLVEDPT